MASIRSVLLDRVLRILTARRLDPHMDPRILRAKLDRLALRFGGKGRIAHGHVEAADVAGIPAEWIIPDRENQEGVLLYLHGGGYTVCSPKTHRGLVADIAVKAGMRALVIDYRLAPEHPFPAAVEDACKAYRWLLAQGIDPAHITVAGDSAGGGLTLALLISLRDAGDPLPAGAALLSPWTDLAMSGWTHVTHARRDPMLSIEGALLAARHYLQGASPTDPLASPLYARLDGLPPLFIHVGGNEILLDDSIRLAGLARAAGVPVELKIWPGLPHVFQAFAFLPEARASRAEIAVFLAGRAGAATGLFHAAD